MAYTSTVQAMISSSSSSSTSSSSSILGVVRNAAGALNSHISRYGKI